MGRASWVRQYRMRARRTSVAREPHSERADLFLDVRVPPTMSMTDARRAAKKLYLTMREKHPEYGLEFETYVSVPAPPSTRTTRW